MASSILQLVVSFLICGGMAMVDAVSNAGSIRRGNFSAAAAGYGVCRSIVEPLGYNCAEHKVTTKDGYILSMQRVASNKSGGSSRKPVLLQHGLFMDGLTWFLLPPSQNLPFLLADNGFDVWIVHSRGAKYSRGHVSYAPDDRAYWDWSWDEMATMDLPATVDYIHDQTKQKLHFVGHSQGNLIGLAAISKGHLVSNLTSVTVLCPIAYMHHMTSFLMRGTIDLFAGEALYWLKIKEFDPNGGPAQKLLEKMCKLPFVECSNLMTALTGKNCCLEPSAMDFFLENEPQPTSTKNLLHLSQMVRRGTIAMYDYDDQDQNVKRYGQPSPPVYDMTEIPKDLPLYLSYGGTDAITSDKDVHILLGSLKDHMGDKLVTQFVDNYAHADYVMADNAREKVFEPLVGFLKQY